MFHHIHFYFHYSQTRRHTHTHTQIAKILTYKSPLRWGKNHENQCENRRTTHRPAIITGFVFLRIEPRFCGFLWKCIWGVKMMEW